MHTNQNSPFLNPNHEASAPLKDALENPTFLRRLGDDPHANGALSYGCDGCPDVWELQSGDFAVIGIDITAQAKAKLPPTAGCGPDERIILVPRNVLIGAKRDLPDKV